MFISWSMNKLPVTMPLKKMISIPPAAIDSNSSQGRMEPQESVLMQDGMLTCHTVCNSCLDYKPSTSCTSCIPQSIHALLHFSHSGQSYAAARVLCGPAVSFPMLTVNKFRVNLPHKFTFL